MALFFSLALLSVAAQAQAALTEYQLKATFIYHFAQFVEWPASLWPCTDSPLVIGLTGIDPFNGALDQVMKGQKVNGHPLLVKRYPVEQKIKDCHVFFIGALEKTELGIHDDFRKILGGSKPASATLDEAESALLGTSTTSAAPGCFEIDSAFQGKQGLELVEQALAQGRPYALAFVDVRMPPGWDGIETVTHIWKTYPDLQVVICTAKSICS